MSIFPQYVCSKFNTVLIECNVMRIRAHYCAVVFSDGVLHITMWR